MNTLAYDPDTLMTQTRAEAINAILNPVARGEVQTDYSQEALRLLGRKKCREIGADGIGQCGTNWVLFRGITENEAKLWCQANGWQDHEVRCAHDCSGQMGIGIDIRKSYSRILITRRWALDI